MDLYAILRGVGAGITYSLTAYGKKEKQKFDWVKFGTSMTLGAISGVIFMIADIPISGGYEFLITAGAVPIVENLFKMAYRKIKKYLWSGQTPQIALP